MKIRHKRYGAVESKSWGNVINQIQVKLCHMKLIQKKHLKLNKMLPIGYERLMEVLL